VNFLDLVRPSVKDIGSGQRIVRRFVEVASNSAALATVSVTLGACPVDTVRVIHTMTFNAVAGAAQTNIANQAYHRDQLSGVIISQIGCQFDYAPVVAGTNTKSITGLEIALMQGEAISADFVFNAGVAANAVSLYVIGWEFPRGNLQR
jgi:hypothetical protein